MDSAGIDDWGTRATAWLRRVPAGKACALFADPIDDGLEALGDIALRGTKPPTVVTLEWNRLPRLSQELSQAATALADATLTLHPALYASAVQRRRDVVWTGTTDRIAANATEHISGAIPSAVRRILASCHARRRPRLHELPLAEEVRQLALALDPSRLVLLLVIRASEWSEAALLPLARGAEWLAANTHAPVVLLLPAQLSGSPALDSVAYRSLHLPAAQVTPSQRSGGGRGAWSADTRESRPTVDGRTDTRGLCESDVPATRHDAPTVGKSVDEPAVSVSPILGRPHPQSEPEQILHRRIHADAELSTLFQYNQLVSIDSGHAPRVDLVWPKGRLIVEVDAHARHSGRHVFFEDRQRDYRLLACGWHVWRIDDQEIVVDAERVIEKLRTLVRLFGKESS